MRFFNLVLLFSLLFASNAFAGEAQISSDTNIVEDFELQPLDRMPPNWMTWPGKRDRAGRVYHVRNENGNKYLEAIDSEGIALPLLKNFYWNVERYPLLSWRWRAKSLPADANENEKSKNDSACAVYVPVGYTGGKSIKYVWSATLPKDTVVTQKDGNLKLKVLETGISNLGKWQTATVNVPQDFQTLFGKKLNKQPRLALMSDSNSLHKTAACDYDDFKLLPAPLK